MLLHTFDFRTTLYLNNSKKLPTIGIVGDHSLNQKLKFFIFWNFILLNMNNLKTLELDYIVFTHFLPSTHCSLC